MSRTISKDRVAVKSGYYFEIFNKSEIPDTLAKYHKKVELNNVVYDLYHGTSLEDEKLLIKCLETEWDIQLTNMKLQNQNVL